SSPTDALGLAALGIALGTAVWPLARAQAQEPSAPVPPPPAAAEAAPAADQSAPVPNAPPPSTATPVPEMPPPPPPAAEPLARPKTPEKRTKNLETTVGMDPTQHDLGPEADLLGAVDLGVPKMRTKGWKYAMH